MDWSLIWRFAVLSYIIGHWNFVYRKKNLNAIVHILFSSKIKCKTNSEFSFFRQICSKILWALRLTNDSDMIHSLSNYSVCRLFLYQNFGYMSKISVIFLPKQHFNLDMTQSWERSIFFHMMMLRSAFQDIKANHTYVRIPTKKTRLK